MVRVRKVIGDYFWSKGQDLREWASRRGSHEDDASTIGTIDGEDLSPTTAGRRSMAAIQALRDDDEKMHPLTIILLKVSVLLIGFPLLSYAVVKATGIMDDKTSAVPKVWQPLALENVDKVSSMAMSRDGSVVAIGAAGCVNLYNVRPTWHFTNGICDFSSHQFGSSVSLSANGAVLAVSGITQDATRPGFVRVYENINSKWLAKGEDFVGEEYDAFFGKSIDLSYSGDTLAIGAPGNSVLLLEGKVDIYEFSSTFLWQLSGTLRSVDNPDQFGGSISLSSSGEVLAVGAPSTTNFGSVEVYRIRMSNWERVAEPLEGQFTNETLGHSVSVATTVGNSIIVAGSSRSLRDTISRVQVFESVNGGPWIQIKDDILHSETDSSDVALSDDGSFLAIAAEERSYLFATKASIAWENSVPYKMSGGRLIAVANGQSTQVAAAGRSTQNDFVAVYGGHL